MEHTRQSIEAIVEKQREFFLSGKTLDVKWRVSQLKKLKNAVIKHESELTSALREDLGRSDFEAYLSDIGPTLSEIDETIRGVRRWAKPERHFSGISCFPSVFTNVYKMPYGVTLIISPFNFPILLTLGVLTASISGGNTAVIKTSSKSACCTKALKALIADTFPPEYVALVEGGHEEADMLLETRFDKIFYTGSPSAQVGCRMGCAFCASTVAGKVRDLSPSEMLDQVLFTQLDSGEEISNVVLMGIGEPLDNKENVLHFLELLNHPDGMHIGMRHVSLSTCGIVPQIDALAQLRLQLTLSVSLHAPDSETRSRLMPVNRAYDVEELFSACHRYFETTGRRISFEYAMIDGVNDRDWQADLIVQRLRGMPGHVNLIPLNEVAESPFKPSRRIRQFQERLESQGVTATVRRSLGLRISRKAMPTGEPVNILALAARATR